MTFYRRIEVKGVISNKNLVTGFRKIEAVPCEYGSNYDLLVLGGECLRLPDNIEGSRLIVAVISKVRMSGEEEIVKDEHRITGYLKNEALTEFLKDPLIDIRDVILECKKMVRKSAPKSESFNIKFLYICETDPQP